MKRFVLFTMLLGFSFYGSSQCDPLCPASLTEGGPGFTCTAFGGGAGICQATIGSSTITCIYSGGVCSESVVPVEFGNVDARKAGKEEITLAWSTLSEINNQQFEVERSYDGIDFIYVDMLDGAGNSNVETFYSYSDEDFETNQTVIYYRIKQVDFDGNFAYSNILSVRNDASSTIISKFGYDDVALQVEIDASSDNTSEIIVADMQGKVFYNASHFLNEGKNNLEIINSNLSGGLYVISVRTEGQNILTRKIFVR